MASLEENLNDKQCNNCDAQSIIIENNQDLIDDLAELAESSNTDVEIISSETEEGQMLNKAFGGIAAILRFRMEGL